LSRSVTGTRTSPLHLQVMPRFSSLQTRESGPATSNREASGHLSSNETEAGRGWSLPARRVLVACVAHEGSNAALSLPSCLAACDKDELVALAVIEGVAGLVSEKLGPHLAPDQYSRLLRAARQHVAHHLGNLGWLKTFGTALEESDVTWMVLKGPVLAELSYGDIGRAYADLDLMVPPHQLRRAVDALFAASATVADQAWPSLIKSGKGELTMTVHGSPLIDLH